MTLEGYIDFLKKRQTYERARNNYGGGDYGYNNSDLIHDVCVFLEENKFQEIPTEERRYWSRKKLVFGMGNKPRQNSTSTDRDSFIYVKLSSTKNIQTFIKDYERHLRKIKNIGIKNFFLSLPTGGIYLDKLEKKKEGIERCFDLTYSPSFGKEALQKLVEVCETKDK